MPIGVSSSVGSTSDYTVTRDRLIQMAHENIRAIEAGQPLKADQLALGIDRLAMIVRETDEVGKWRWTVQDATHVSLAANTTIYDANNGLPQNIAELMSVVYRDSSGCDSAPLKILRAEGYEEKPNKLQLGDPLAVYLTGEIQLSTRRLYIWPTPSGVTAQTVVSGTDGNIYKCIYPHTSSLVTRPVDGANWRMVWQLGGLAPATWASGAAYTSGSQLRMVIRRPIYDFDAADTTPDFPIQWPRTLLYRLCADLAETYGLPLDERVFFSQKAKAGYDDIVPSLRAKSTDIHNKTLYF